MKSSFRNFSFSALWLNSFPGEAQAVTSAFQRGSQAFGFKILCSDAKEKVLQASKNLSTEHVQKLEETQLPLGMTYKGKLWTVMSLVF